MNRLGIAVLTFSCWAALAVPAKPKAVVERSASGISGPAYSVLLDRMAELERKYPEMVEILDYGKSVQGRTLRMLLVIKNDEATKRLDHPTLLMSGSTHGNEYLNIEDRLPGRLLQRARAGGPLAEFIEKGGAFIFVPILNPDGYDNNVRENANGVDLNRDWDLKPAGYHGFKQIETRLLAEKLEQLHQTERLQYKVTVDYHCCIGAVLHPWGYTGIKMPEADLLRHQAAGELANKFLNIDVGPTGEILGYFPVGTTKDYYYDKYGAVSFTFEGRYKVEQKHFDKHVAWWEAMVEQLLRDQRTPFARVTPAKPIHALRRLAD